MKRPLKNLDNTYKIFFIALVLFIIAAIYYFTENKGTISQRRFNFAVESTEKIDKIKISSANQKLTLVKENAQWKINGKYIARQRLVDNFLMALNRIQISTPLSANEKKQTAEILEKEGRLVEILSNKRTLRKYYVSTPDINTNKTYMMMVKRGEPIVVRIPSFKGLVAELFITDENLWRDKTIFDYQPQNIKAIHVEYPKEPSNSFEVIHLSDGTFALKNEAENIFVEDFEVKRVVRYFTYFQKIAFERIEKELSEHKKDSLLMSAPYCKISVTDVENYTNSITIFRKPAEQEFDEFGNKITFDYNRAYAIFNQNNELIIIQYYIFDPLLKEIDYFR